MKKHSLFILSLLATVSVFGQEVVGSSGQTLSNGQLTVYQTIGETITGSFTNGISINQGFHQNEVILTSIGEQGEKLALSVYPNPFVQSVFVSSEEELGLVSIYDMKGTLVFQHQAAKGETAVELELSHLSSGHYLLRDQAINRAKSQSIIKK